MKDTISEKLFGQHEDFLNYCRKSGKVFVNEISAKDFCLYQAAYSVTDEEIEELRKLLEFDEAKDAVRKYFNIEDISSYKNMLVSELSFDEQIEDYLKSNGYIKFGDILITSMQDFITCKDWDRKSFESFLGTLEKFFEVASLKNFEGGVSNRELLIQKINKLPDEFKNKKVRPFLQAFKLNVDSVNGEWSFADFAAYLENNSYEFISRDFVNFVSDFKVYLTKRAKNISDLLFKDERAFYVAKRRANGYKLVDIGKDLGGLTRERIRQIELRSINRLMEYESLIVNVICIIRLLGAEKTFMTVEKAESFIDAEFLKIVLYFAKKTSCGQDIFHFDENINAIVFHNAVEFGEDEFVKTLPTVIEEKNFSELIKKLAIEKNSSEELIRLKLEKIYNRRGNFLHIGYITLTEEYNYILKKYFPEGYKIADNNYYLPFVKHIKELFNEKTPPTRRSVDAIISRVGVLCGRGKYIHADFAHVPTKIIDKIKKFIDDSPCTAIFYNEIFESLKDFLKGTKITNHYFLQGIIKLYKLPYTIRKNYVTKSDEVDVLQEFKKFVTERGEVSAKEIKEKFRSFQSYNIEMMAGRCPEILAIGVGVYMHASLLKLKKTDFDPIKDFVLKNCTNAISSRNLFVLFQEKFPEFLKRNEIKNHSKLFGVLQYMFGNDFHFSRPYICAMEVKEISMRKILLQILEGVEEVTIKEVVKICGEKGLHYNSKNYLIEILRPDFIRIDGLTLKRPETIGVTDKIISAAFEKVMAAIEKNGGWQAVRVFDEYESLPPLKMEWNSFLLESIVSIAENAPDKLTAPHNSSDYSFTIFVSKEFADDDLVSFLKKVVIAKHKKIPFHSEKEIFSWLQKQGLCNKKLPKFLEGGKAAEILGNFGK